VGESFDGHAVDEEAEGDLAIAGFEVAAEEGPFFEKAGDIVLSVNPAIQGTPSEGLTGDEPIAVGRGFEVGNNEVLRDKRKR